MIEKYYSRGKILISGEYLVLKGAKSLALPLKLGQSLEVESNNQNILYWRTFEKGQFIFDARLNLNDFTIIDTNDKEKAKYISKLLTAVKKIKPSFLNSSQGVNINAKIEFNMQWGLGTSSTLINNIAQWAKINPFELNSQVSTGSGYDIACASANSPITYQVINSKAEFNSISFNPKFINNLYLVYQNRKVATENNIKDFLLKHQISATYIKKMSSLTDKLITCSTIKEFMYLINEHDTFVGSIINQKPIKQIHFSDYPGAIKSLGAWGGDFILTASTDNFEKQRQYFNNKGYNTVIPLKDLII